MLKRQYLNFTIHVTPDFSALKYNVHHSLINSRFCQNFSKPPYIAIQLMWFSTLSRTYHQNLSLIVKAHHPQKCACLGWCDDVIRANLIKLSST